MRAIILGLGLALLTSAVAAQSEHYVNGYMRSDGTYVAPHMQTNPNGTRNDNWSTRGNVNPYTGQPGTKAADAYGSQPYRAPAYGSSFGRPADPNSSFNHPATTSSYGTPAPYGEGPN